MSPKHSTVLTRSIPVVSLKSSAGHWLARQATKKPTMKRTSPAPKITQIGFGWNRTNIAAAMIAITIPTQL